jgi:GT2 family glycosyltransferase
MSPAPKPGSDRLATIVVPCFGQLEHTRRCVEALARHTRTPWELVAVDNGSTDGTPGFLRGLGAGAASRVEVITNPENRGFPAACNQGLAAARGDYLVLLNNDAIVTHAWLDQLIALAESDARIGMAGPMTNYASPPQLVPDATYADLADMDRFARSWRAEHRGRWFRASKLSGFCLLIKRAAYEAVGGLDERFGLGLFDDDDLSLRVRQAGFDLVVAMDLFVHHSGSRTFAGAGIDQAALLAENLAKFEGKWGPDAVASSRPVSLQPWAGAAPSAPSPTEMAPSPGVSARAALPRLPRAWDPPPPARPEGERPAPRLAPGTAREMVLQALTILGSSACDASRRASLWERLAAQVAEHGRRNGSTWGMQKLLGADGSIIYLGRASEFLVIAASGTLFRGKGIGCLEDARGGFLVPRYTALAPVAAAGHRPGPGPPDGGA